MKRKLWIDHARGICAFCVLIAHQTTNECILHLFNGFFLMLFFFISGYLYRDKSLKESWKNVVRSLLIPYILLSVLGTLLYTGELKLLFSGNIDYIISLVNNIIMGRNLWFVACLVCVRILFIGIYSLLSKINKWNTHIIFMVSLTAILTIFFVKDHPANEAPIWYWTTSIYSLGFYALGYFCRRIDLENYLPKLKWYYGVLMLIIYSLISYFTQKYFYVEFHVYTDYFESPLAFILLAIVGISCVCVMSYSLCDRMGGNILDKYIIALGQNSLLLFAINGKVRLTLEKIISVVPVPSCFEVIYILTSCVAQGVVILIVGYFVNKYIPFIVGKHK